MDNRIIILPIADFWTYVGITIFFIVLILIFIFSYVYVKRSEIKDTRWSILLKFLLRHDLAVKEVEFIHEFYLSLEQQIQEEIITSTKRFHHLLNEHLLKSSTLDAEEKVNILEKLFPAAERFEEIRTLLDVMTGEVCAVEALSPNPESETQSPGQEPETGAKFMGAIVKKSPDELMISIDDFDPLVLGRNAPVGIYVYRPHIGGFLFHGTVRQPGPDFILFSFNGKIEQKSGHHLMAQIETPVLFKPWPMPAPGEKGYDHEISGNTYLFSDRALVFSPANEADIHFYLNRHEIWSVSAKLPGGYVFTCRGTIFPSKFYDKMFVFKFLDAGETSRNILFLDIKEHEPVSEHIA